MKYLILGAGPAGLTFANILKLKGVSDFLVLEAENEAGGLCRSFDVDGYPLDIGGGHFLDVRRPDVVEFLFQFMPEDEWNRFHRVSKIFVHDQYIDHPFEANIWQFDIDKQVEYLVSIAQAGCNSGTEEPDDFVRWIEWKLGEEIAADYMIPYNRKMFGNCLNELGTYWLNKLPNVSFEDTLRSCLMHKAYGSEPGHAEFYYPKKYGYGELWRRMADNVSGNIEYGKRVTGIDFDNRVVRTVDGDKYRAESIITTIPWNEFSNISGMLEDIRLSIKNLKSTSVTVQYYDDDIDTSAQWIYYPDPEKDYHRILVRKNFINNCPGYWTETNVERLDNSNRNTSMFCYINKYAYPLNTIDKPSIMEKLLLWSREHDVYGLGRWGEHMHYNSDLVVERAMKMAGI